MTESRVAAVKRFAKPVLAGWCVLLLAAVANGVFREAVLAPQFGDALAEPASTLILLALIAAVAWRTVSRLAPPQPVLWAIGAVWVSLTLLFEVVFFRWVMGRSWAQLYQSLNPVEGGFFSVVLLGELLSPVIAGWRRPKTGLVSRNEASK